MSTKTRFEREAKDNSEMAYYLIVAQGHCLGFLDNKKGTRETPLTFLLVTNLELVTSNFLVSDGFYALGYLGHIAH